MTVVLPNAGQSVDGVLSSLAVERVVGVDGAAPATPRSISISRV